MLHSIYIYSWLSLFIFILLFVVVLSCLIYINCTLSFFPCIYPLTCHCIEMAPSKYGDKTCIHNIIVVYSKLKFQNLFYQYRMCRGIYFFRFFFSPLWLWVLLFKLLLLSFSFTGFLLTSSTPIRVRFHSNNLLIKKQQQRSVFSSLHVTSICIYVLALVPFGMVLCNWKL